MAKCHRMEANNRDAGCHVDHFECTAFIMQFDRLKQIQASSDAYMENGTSERDIGGGRERERERDTKPHTHKENEESKRRSVSMTACVSSLNSVPNCRLQFDLVSWFHLIRGHSTVL